MAKRKTFDVSGIPQIPNQNESDESALLELFNKTRSEITERIKKYSAQLVKFEELTTLSVELYSYRQLLVEDRYKLYETSVELNKRIKIKTKTTYDNLIGGTATDRKMLVEAAISDTIYKNEIVQNHVNFLDSTIKNVDNLIWGVRLRVDIEKIQNGIM
jgi:hypothetical protein